MMNRKWGRHAEHDLRSLTYKVVAPSQPLVTMAWQRHCDPYDQGQLGSCTGNAMAGALMTGPLFDPSRILTEKDAVDIYSLATKLDKVPGHYPPDDTGSSGLAVAKAAHKLGLLRAYHHAFSLEDVLASLSHIGPVIIGIGWYEGFSNPVGPDARLEVSGSVLGGHEMEVNSIDVEKKLIGGVNSWGTTWGNKGYWTMSWDTFERLLQEHGDCVVPLK